jgi:hypothetical protein
LSSPWGDSARRGARSLAFSLNDCLRFRLFKSLSEQFKVNLTVGVPLTRAVWRAFNPAKSKYVVVVNGGPDLVATYFCTDMVAVEAKLKVNSTMLLLDVASMFADVMALADALLEAAEQSEAAEPPEPEPERPTPAKRGRKLRTAANILIGGDAEKAGVTICA